MLLISLLNKVGLVLSDSMGQDKYAVTPTTPTSVSETPDPALRLFVIHILNGSRITTTVSPGSDILARTDKVRGALRSFAFSDKGFISGHCPKVKYRID